MQKLVSIEGLRESGIFPDDLKPSIRTLRDWTRHQRIPYRKVGKFTYFDPVEVLAHINSKMRMAAR